MLRYFPYLARVWGALKIKLAFFVSYREELRKKLHSEVEAGERDKKEIPDQFQAIQKATYIADKVEYAVNRSLIAFKVWVSFKVY